MGECPRDRTTGQPHSFQVVLGAQVNLYAQSQGTVLFCTKCGQSYLLQKEGWKRITVSEGILGEASAQDQDDDDAFPHAFLGARPQDM